MRTDAGCATSRTPRSLFQLVERLTVVPAFAGCRGTRALLDDAAGDAGAGVAGRVGLQVVALLVDDDAVADDPGLGVVDGDSLDRGVVGRLAVGVGFEVP